MHGALWYVFLGSRGGETRSKIVSLLRDHPMNAHQLKKDLDVDYSTIRHNLRVLEKNRIVMVQKGYGAMYELTPEFETMLDDYDLLLGCQKDNKKCTRPKWEKLLKEKKKK
jgi:predicted transcriptional regulator